MTEPNQNPPPAQPILPHVQPQATAPAAQPQHTVVAAIPPSFVAEKDSLAKQLAEAQARITLLESDKSALLKGSDEAGKLATQLGEQLKLTEAEKEKHRVESRETKLVSTMKEIAARLDVTDQARVDALVKLARAELTVAEDGSVVSAADPKVTAEVHLKAFVEQRQWLQNSRVAAGSGASPISPAGVGGAPAIDLSTNEGMTSFARQHGSRVFPIRKVG